MSRFRVSHYRELVPYVPGEQPRGGSYIKLNTNESPFPPSPEALARGREALALSALYPDPTMQSLREAIADCLGVSPDSVLPTNGSDEILNFAFAAFCDGGTPAVFPDITYGFYSVFAELYRLPTKIIPLREDFGIEPSDLFEAGGTVFLANPNAPTGRALPLSAIEEILAHNRDNIVLIDEAYVDFGAESAVSLLPRYENLVVARTFSKSRSMAGARLGFGVASPALIEDLTAIKDSTNPYNVSRATAAMGIGSLADADYFEANRRSIIETRETVREGLLALGFSVLPSSANFLFARHGALGGRDFYLALKERGVLVRHFESPRIADYNRITVGSAAEMQEFLRITKEILEELS